MSARGIVNSNPLNIRINPDNKWQGRIPLDKNTDGTFEQFQEAYWGWRAAAVLIIGHYDRRGANTIAKLITIWSPQSENETGKYITFVATQTGFGANAPLNFHTREDIRPVMLAMCRMECGTQPYDDNTIDKGLMMAGIGAPTKPLSKSRTMKAGTVGVAATAGAGVLQSLSGFQDTLSALVPYLDIAKYVLLAIILLSIGVTLYARIDDSNKAIR